MPTAGVVTAARREAAQAGARMLAAGGTAADAAVATAFALTVTDPANCGIGGYGGHAVVDPGGGSAPLQIDFNTAAPAAVEDAALQRAPRRAGFAYGGISVARPSVVAGLAHIHARFGRLPWADLLAPAIELATNGFTIGPDLARALGWAREKPETFAPEFWRVFPAGAVAESDRVVQPDLLGTLRIIAREGAEAFRAGPLVDAVVQTVRQADGVLGACDFADHHIVQDEAIACGFGDASIHGPPPRTTGFGVLASALSATSPARRSAARDAAYIARVAEALRAAWQARRGEARAIVGAQASAPHTTHLCAADAEGKIVALTFTHGPLWFGSGIVVPGTGMVLNCGANLLVYDCDNGRRVARTNMAPIIARGRAGTRYALGTPGGHRIPAILLTALIDVLAAGQPLSDALAQPRVATSVEGELEVEPALSRLAPDARIIRIEEFYGPASGVTVTSAGAMIAAGDPRFRHGIASVDPSGNIL